MLDYIVSRGRMIANDELRTRKEAVLTYFKVRSQLLRRVTEEAMHHTGRQVSWKRTETRTSQTRRGVRWSIFYIRFELLVIYFFNFENVNAFRFLSCM
jgi:hypothetical protein